MYEPSTDSYHDPFETEHDPIRLGTEAIIRMLCRNGNVWGSDAERYLERHITTVLVAVAELSDDYPGGDDAAEATLRTMLDRDPD